MATKALSHQMTRTVLVDRMKLLDALKVNRENHLAEFNEAMVGYKAMALRKVEEAFAGLDDRLKKQKADIVEKIGTFSPETADGFSDYLVILHQVGVDLKKPVSYVEAYDAAIDMAKFDTRDVLELSGAEFQCFVRDVWDWTHEFTITNTTYGVSNKRR